MSSPIFPDALAEACRVLCARVSDARVIRYRAVARFPRGQLRRGDIKALAAAWVLTGPALGQVLRAYAVERRAAREEYLHWSGMVFPGETLV